MAEESRRSDGAVALLSIRPEYADRVSSGEKRVEFRRHNFRRDITHVVLYSTSPVSRLVGLCEVARVVRGSPAELWSDHGRYGGIEEDALLNYMDGVTAGTALILRRFQPFERDVRLSALGLERAPQSFQYLSQDDLARLRGYAALSANSDGSLHHQSA